MNALMIIGLCLMLPLVITLLVRGIVYIVKGMKDPLFRIIAVLIMFAMYTFGLVLFNLSL